MNRFHSISRFFPPLPALHRLAPLHPRRHGLGRRFASLRHRRRPVVPVRLLGCFHGLCQWASLPLAIWLSNGWVGLLANWQELSGVSSLLEKPAAESKGILPTPVSCGEILAGGASCAAVKSEAR
jgi:hypothetical protein